MAVPSFLDLVAADLQLVEQRLLQVVHQADDPELARVLNQPFRGQGKHLRPALVLLAAGSNGSAQHGVVSFAAGIEALHTGTLVHDDLIDGAPLRRGQSTVSHLWGDRVALYAGDYLCGWAMALVAEAKNTRVSRLVARTLDRICRGEMQQAVDAHSSTPSRQAYFQRIEGKTASLFSAAEEGGAILGGASEPGIAALRDHGLNLGMAFQIVDDILDFVGEEEELGKPRGTDLRQRTVTLPVICFLESHGEEARGDLLRRILLGTAEEEDLASAIEMVAGSPAIAQAYAVAQEFVNQAKDALGGLSEDPYHRALMDLADYAVNRHR